MKKLFLLSLFLCTLSSPFLSSAQDFNIDSLVKTIEYDHDTVLLDRLYSHGSKMILADIEDGFQVLRYAYSLNQKLDYNAGMIKWFLLQGKYYRLKSDWTNMEACADSAFAFAQVEDYIMGMAEAKGLKARVCAYTGEYSRGLRILEEVLPLFEQLDEKMDQMIVLGNMAIMHDNLGDLPLAVEKNLRSLTIARSMQDSAIISILLVNTGITYRSLEDYDKALDNFKEGLQIRTALGHKRALPDLLGNIGVVYKNLGQYDSARHYFQKQLDSSLELDIKSDQAAALHNFGSVEFRQARYKSALNYYEKSLALKEAINSYKKGKAHTLINIGLCHSYLGSYSKADLINQRALTYGVEMENLSIQIDAYSNQVTNFNLAKDYKAAFEYNQLYDQLRDSLLNEEKVNAMAKFEKRYETAEKERQILAQDLEIQKKEASLKSQQNQIIISTSSFLLIVLAGGFGFYRNKQREKVRVALVRSEEQQRNFKAVITATEDERKRIAKDLHDGVVQQLGAIKLTLAHIQPSLEPKKSEEVEKVRLMAESAADETRNLSHQMMPKALIEMGLLTAMKGVLEPLALKNIEVNFENFGLNDRYENSVEITVYRIFQELINNIVKHSRATHVEVQLYQNQGKLILIVEDNGQGISPQSKQGLGLSNIKSRLTTVDGKVDYSSRSDNGTVATVVIPI